MTTSFSGAVYAADEPGVGQSDLIVQHIDSAKGYMNAGQWSFANYEWRAALNQDPMNVEANVGLAETLMQSGYVPDALKHLKEVRRTLKKLSIELQYGKALEMSKDFVGAEKVYLSNLEKVPLEPKSIERLSAILPYLPEAQQIALQAYLENIALEAGKSGRKALKFKNYAEAARNFEVSTALAPNVMDMNDYGVVLLLLGRYDEAFKQFDILKRAQADKWELHANSAFVVLGKGNAFEAATHLERAIGLCREASKKPLLYNDLGFIYESQNRWQKAMNAYARAVELDPTFTKAKLNLAYAYQKDMAYDKAIKIYQDILLSKPADADVLNRLGFVYELAHKERLALQSYRKATEASPKEQEGFYNLAILYKKMGKSKESDLAYKRLMDIEFNKMEAGKGPDAKTPDGKTPDGKSTASVPGSTSAKALSEQGNRKAKNKRLLDYVDVFFSSEASPST